MRYFVRMAEKLTFRVKKCSNYKPAIMILCMLAYTDHSPSSSINYDHTLWISRGEWSVYAFMYKIMMVGIVGVYLHDKDTFFCYTKSCFGHVTIFWHFTVCFELRSARKFLEPYRF